MTLRFEVNQAEAFRRGVNVQKSTNHIDVDPASITQEERNLIADRLHGIDVCELDDLGEKLFTTGNEWERVYKPFGGVFVHPKRIVSALPTFEALMEAVRENEMQVDRRMTICALVLQLKELLANGRDGKVYIMEHDNPKKGQLPVEHVRLESENGLGMAVLTTSTSVDEKADKHFTVKSLIDHLKGGWPETGRACAEFLPDSAGGLQILDIRKVQWRTLIHGGETPVREPVVAIEVA